MARFGRLIISADGDDDDDKSGGSGAGYEHTVAPNALAQVDQMD